MPSSGSNTVASRTSSPITARRSLSALPMTSFKLRFFGENLLAAERQQLPGQSGGTLARVMDFREQFTRRISNT